MHIRRLNSLHELWAETTLELKMILCMKFCQDGQLRFWAFVKYKIPQGSKIQYDEVEPDL